MNNCGISRWDDPNEINARLKALTSQPIWEVTDEYYNNVILKYFDEKCKASKAVYEESKEYIPGGVQHPQEGVLSEGIPLGGDGEAGRSRRVPGLIEPLNALLLLQQGNGVAEEFLALGGEFHAPVAADEELDAQLLLQLPDGGGDAGLGQHQLVGCLVDRAALGDLHHVSQLLKGHAAPSSI